MADLPNVADLTGSGTTESQFATALGLLYEYLAQLMVGSERQELSILDGAITPLHTFMTVDTENTTTTDNLDRIIADNIGAKMIAVRCKSSARAVTLRHAQSGSGQILLSGNTNLTLDHVNKIVILFYNSATDTWEEMWKNFGIFVPNASDKTAARTTLGIGTAGALNVGSGINDIPQISQLGALAFLATINDPSLIANNMVRNNHVQDAQLVFPTKFAPNVTKPNSILTFNSSGQPAVLEQPATPSQLIFKDSILKWGVLNEDVVYTAGENVIFADDPSKGRICTTTSNPSTIVTVSIPIAGTIRIKSYIGVNPYTSTANNAYRQTATLYHVRPSTNVQTALVGGTAGGGYGNGIGLNVDSLDVLPGDIIYWYGRAPTNGTTQGYIGGIQICVAQPTEFWQIY